MKNRIKIISTILCSILIFSMSLTSMAASFSESSDLSAEKETATGNSSDSSDLSSENESSDSSRIAEAVEAEDSTDADTDADADEKDASSIPITITDEYIEGSERTESPDAGMIDESMETPEISKIIRVNSGDTSVYWTAVSEADGYEIQTATDRDFSDAKSEIISKGTSSSQTIKDLSTTEDTYVRMRTIKTTNTASDDADSTADIADSNDTNATDSTTDSATTDTAASFEDSIESYSPWGNVCLMLVYQTDWTYAANSKINSGTAVLFYSNSENAKNLTIAINAGHGTKGGSSQKTLCHPDGSKKVTGGSSAAGSKYVTAINEGTILSGNVSEAAQNLKIANEAKEKLLAEGYNVLMLRQESDVQLDNIARTVLANQYADAHISIHFDSTSSNKGAFAITVPTSAKYRNMEPVKSHYKEHNALATDLVSGLKTSGVKIWKSKYMALDLTQTSYSTIPSVDLEVGDRKTSKSTETVNKMAAGIVNGVNSYFN